MWCFVFVALMVIEFLSWSNLWIGVCRLALLTQKGVGGQGGCADQCGAIAKVTSGRKVCLYSAVNFGGGALEYSVCSSQFLWRSGLNDV